MMLTLHFHRCGCPERVTWTFLTPLRSVQNDMQMFLLTEMDNRTASELAIPPIHR